MITTHTTPPGSAEPIVNQYGDTIAVLHWQDNLDGTDYAPIDDATIVRRRDGTVTVECQDTTTGKVRRYSMPDTVSAFYALGLSAHRCNGTCAWNELANMPGLAGCD
ncbi:hypothetical protein [Amycolatopsis sp. CA-230715]|uniref:hypothetical protein n=1 Tax=Amycolatopsis sp. CA-230715 TaxID=2745196 RepID=UPI001C028B30|nr:hypothetical protein [Amycolatopsis sp. CA-230715]QWF81027.1 hypothetical protein HUW46_04452 [Amycolatopsis sp. CA-230715]